MFVKKTRSALCAGKNGITPKTQRGNWGGGVERTDWRQLDGKTHVRDVTSHEGIKKDKAMLSGFT